jgi:hypothetical protein
MYSLHRLGAARSRSGGDLLLLLYGMPQGHYVHMLIMSGDMMNTHRVSPQVKSVPILRGVFLNNEHGGSC